MPEVRQITSVMASQMGKTELTLCSVGHRLDDDPKPVLYLGPTKDNVLEEIEPRIMTMIEGCDSLYQKMVTGKTSTKTNKKIGGTKLRMTWAGSRAGLRSMAACDVHVDELDAMMPLKGEGSQLQLVTARQATYRAESKLYVNSTCTLGTVETYEHEETGFTHWKTAEPEKLDSQVWQEWQEGTREEWAVPCPHCGEYFIPRFNLLIWDSGATKYEALENSWLACPNNGCLIYDRSRGWMNDHGRFIGPGMSVDKDGTVHGELSNRVHRSFWISGIMSAFVSFGERAYKWIEAVASRDPAKIQVVKNTGFGELYAVSGEAPPWEKVYECRDGYKELTVPHGVQKIFLTVDVQGNRFVCAVRGWGFASESWGIHKFEIWGTPTDETDPCWQQLEDALDAQYGGMSIEACAIDTGYAGPQCDKFAKKFKSRVYAIVGRDNPAKLYNPKLQETDRSGKPKKYGLKRWTLDHGYFKGWVHERIGWPSDQVGAWHIPDDYDEDYCKQIVAEEKIQLSTRTIWNKIRNDNHYLDCEYMQVFLSRIRGVQNLQPMPEDAEKKSTAKSIGDLAKQLNKGT